MAVINPISPNTKPTAVLMNAVWGEFDRKLTKILSGKSFLLARGQQFAPALMGKIFYFCDDRTQTIYSQRAPGFTTGTPGVDAMPIPYDHQVFVTALAAVEADIAANPSHAAWDDTNRIVTVPVIPNSAYAFTDADYGSLPYEQWLDGAGTRAMGLCDHSLAAHTILHQGPKDASPAPYFVQEQGAVPEKRHKFALAEIVVEGLTTLDIPDNYDKYNCFRIHNLSMEPLTVTFGSHYTVELEPYGCACVRRDSVTENYRQGFTYFFKFEKGDPRFAWFHATQQDPYQNLGGSQVGIIGGSSMMRVSNSMQANNLINPLGLHDWVGYMSVTEDWLAMNTEASFGYGGWGVLDPNGNDPRYAWFARDPSIVADAYPANQKVIGDPSNPGTLLGDLLFHPGQIIVARTSRTDKDPTTGNYQTIFSVINYRGMATMVGDFAAGGVTVYVESDTSLPTYGQLCFKNALSDICELIPISTNLFKYWDVNQGEEVHKPLVALHDQWNQNLPNHGQPAPSLDLAVFENPPSLHTSAPSGFMLASTAPASVFQRYLNVSDDSRSWGDLVWDEGNGGFWNTVVRTLTVPGAIKFISVPNPTVWRKNLAVSNGAPGWSCKPLHQVTVADLLDLSWWGNPQLSDQGTPYVTFSNKQLTLTDQGLVLSFDETISVYEPGGNNNGLAMSGDLSYWKLGQLTRTRVFQFRGHGWGHTGQGSKSMGFVSRRRGRQAVNTPYLNNEVSGPDGADFSLPRRSASQTQHRVLRRFKQSEMVLPTRNSRFWRNGGKDVDVFLKNYHKTGWYGAVTFNSQFGYYICDPQKPQALDGFDYPTNMTRLTDSEVFALPLLVEHYNGMAAAVNSLTTGYGLTCACLQWRVGRLLSLTPGSEFYIPEPMDSFASFSGVSDMFDLANHLGLTVNGPPTLPEATEMPQNCMVMFVGRVSGGVTGASANSQDAGGDTILGSITIAYTGTMTPHPFSPGDLAKGIAPAGRGWTPGPLPPDGAVGDYYICTQSGWDGSTYWCKGDVLIWNQTNTWGANAGWSRHSGAQQVPGMAFVPQTGQWVRISAQAVGTLNYPPELGSWAVATNRLGKWDPPSLPSSTNVKRGDYYDINSTNRDMGAFAGGKLIWDGTQWVICNSDYADFHWISISEVKDFMESLGFNMVYNEPVIPLSFGWEEQGVSGQTDGVYEQSRSDTMPMYAIPWGNSYGNTLLQAAQSLNVNILPSASICMGYTGARWQFTTSTETDPAKPTYPDWKIRANPYALWDDGILADLRNWGFDPGQPSKPPAAIEEYFSYAASFDGGMGFVVGDWLLFCPGGNDTAWPNIGLDVGRPASGCPYQFPESALWGGLWVGGNDNLFLCGRAEASPDLFAAAFYQHVAYAVLSANSEGTNPQSSFTIIPVGNFITDGDAGLASDWDFQKMVWGDVLPFRYIAPGPEDTPQTVVPGASGLTALEATGTGVATLQYSINLNAIALE